MMCVVYACSLNGPTWLPSELSVICSDHFLEIKSVDDPSFIPVLFPTDNTEDISSELLLTEKQVTENDMSQDVNVLQKVMDKLPVLSAVDPSRAGPAPRRADTSQLQEAFREVACHVCRLLVAHDSELLIEGTVGVTVDGGARVILVHFADQVRKNEEASNVEQRVRKPMSEHPAEGNIPRNVAKNDAKDAAVNKMQTSVYASEEKIPAVGSAECGMSLSPCTANSPQNSSMSLKIKSDLDQEMASTGTTLCVSTGLQWEGVGSSAHKRKAELDNSTITTVHDKPKQQTLLRELLCAPLPPKRPCRPPNAAAAATAAGRGEVLRPRRPTANSAVLDGLLRTGNYQRGPNFSPVGSIYDREVRPRHEPAAVIQAGYPGRQTGVDVHSPQFGGNAVRALLRLASEHAATGRHDLLRNNKHRENGVSPSDCFVNDISAETSGDRRFGRIGMLYRNLVASDIGGSSLEVSNSSQNIMRNDSSTAICSSSELASLTVKQEVIDEDYE